jgi:hypothetical protein
LRITVFIGLVVAICLLPTSARGGVLAVFGDTQHMSGVMQSLKSQRVDFVGMGDSNQILGGTGWDDGFQYAMGQRAPMYATGLLSACENGGQGAGTGFGFSTAGPVGLTTTPFPAQLSPFVSNLFPSSPPAGYGTFSGFSGASPLSMGAPCPLKTTSPLVFELHYGTFATGTHTATIGLRKAIPGFDVLGTTVVNGTTGAYGVTHADLTVAADASRDYPLVMHWAVPSGPDSIDMAWMYSRAYNPSEQSGFSYSTLAAYGGQPSRILAGALKSASDTSLTYYFSQLRRLQGASKNIVLVINEGFNDRGDSSMSVGDSPAVGSSAAGFKDNTLAIVKRITAIWLANGWDTQELSWVFMPSHPVFGSDDALLAAYRQAARELTSVVPQSVAVDLSELTSVDEMTANGWYFDGGGSDAHLSTLGYEQLSLRAVDAMSVPEPSVFSLAGFTLAAGLFRRDRARKATVS